MTLSSNNAGGLLAKDCISGRTISFGRHRDAQDRRRCDAETENDLPFIGPGLIDIQINGVNGVDFNSETLKEEELLSASGYLMSRGITTFYPTVITNSIHNIRKILSVIDRACRNHHILDQSIGGIHLEGPFISKTKGYRGAHDKRYVIAPDWEIFCSLQKASGNRIRIVSLAPEWDGAVDFIKNCKNEGLVVGIAHSNADTAQINAAVDAGASLSTHLGNSVPVMLPRHPNIIWDQLANDRLFASIIADGFHIPDSLIKTVMTIKGEKAILISDATNFSGMLPGVYESHIGREVVLEEGGRLSMKGKDGLLAGASKLLPENIQYLIGNKLADLSKAWQMGSASPAKLLGIGSGNSKAGSYPDAVIFKIKNGKIVVSEVFKNGKTVWELQSV